VYAHKQTASIVNKSFRNIFSKTGTHKHLEIGI